jgi:hypothetical protein
VCDKNEQEWGWGRRGVSVGLGGSPVQDAVFRQSHSSLASQVHEQGKGPGDWAGVYIRLFLVTILPIGHFRDPWEG